MSLERTRKDDNRSIAEEDAKLRPMLKNRWAVLSMRFAWLIVQHITKRGTEEMGTFRNPPPNPALDMRYYAPPASRWSDEEHEQARRDGYQDARDRWADRMQFRQFADFVDSTARRWREQYKKDKDYAFGSGGLAAMGRARGAMSYYGAAGRPDPDQVGLAGMLHDRIHSISERMGELGVSWRTDESQVSPQHREEFRELKESLRSTAERLYSLDMDGALRKAGAGRPRTPADALLEDEDYTPDDPELQRVFTQYRGEMAVYESEHRSEVASEPLRERRVRPAPEWMGDNRQSFGDDVDDGQDTEDEEPETCDEPDASSSGWV
ncbi:MAG: hypothetical protein HZB26_00510 [Candidatus Hydrogenedentes bacterium]|nr:hypothetical protein [Candidatus Hydrogenedentota bacterium]